MVDIVTPEGRESHEAFILQLRELVPWEGQLWEGAELEPVFALPPEAP